jgi:formate dehydrogenase iron-sulfur subunit
MGELRTLLDEVIAEQRQLTAVTAFARAHDLGEIKTTRYRELIPLTLPAPGQQFAFEVDLDKCSGCKACVAACHSLNGLDEGESWRSTGVLVSDDWRLPFRQTVPTACHHCVDPACLNGCPVLAYEKETTTGIVRHLDDQCIGCQYCVMMCPYEVPQYSEKRGIVRKCDMCTQRLAAGEAPACVQACPGEAIRIALVETETLVTDFREAHSENSFLPSSPDPAITVPTTRFVSARPRDPALVPADATAVREQPAHWPLVWMLVLTQLGVGATAAATLSANQARASLVTIALVATVLGLTASVMHLGQPLKAWRSFLGLRTSWLSREIVMFGIFAALLFAAAISAWQSPVGKTTATLLPLASIAGLLGIACSGYVYHATRRVLWSGSRAFGSFFGTCVLLGSGVAWAFEIPYAPVLVALSAAFKLGAVNALLVRATGDPADLGTPKPGDFDQWSLARTALFLRDEFAFSTRARIMLLVVGGIVMPLVSVVLSGNAIVVTVAFALCVGGELIERYLFFRAVVPARMPGGS